MFFAAWFFRGDAERRERIEEQRKVRERRAEMQKLYDRATETIRLDRTDPAIAALINDEVPTAPPANGGEEVS